MIVRCGKRRFECETAETFFEKMKGLMFSGKKNILFVFEKERIFGIHSFFVLFPFDAVYLDERRRAVEVMKNILPFTPYVRNSEPAKYLLELAEPNTVKVGDRLGW